MLVAVPNELTEKIYKTIDKELNGLPISQSDKENIV